MVAKTQKPEGDGLVNISIAAPNFGIAKYEIIGTTPYVQSKFSEKTKQQMLADHMKGDTKKSEKTHDKKDPEALYKQSMHISKDGWHGIPVAAFRNSMISACKISGVIMTHAKLEIFVEADGYDADDGLIGLVEIISGEPQRNDSYVRLANGAPDIRIRAMWTPGWRAIVTIRYDADHITPQALTNLLMKAGAQVGIGEGRPDSKKSNGMGWGLFDIANEKTATPTKRGRKEITIA